MERLVLQALAQAKLDDAELLFQHGRFANSYYLFGYAAELAIKSRISGLFRAGTIPDRKLVNDIYSHDLNKLMGLAGLVAELEASRKASAVFDGYRATVASWAETSRYEVVEEFRSAAMRDAMMHADEGVFQWLQARW